MKQWYDDWKYGLTIKGDIELEIPYTREPTYLTIKKPSRKVKEMGTLLMCALYDLTQRGNKDREYYTDLDRLHSLALQTDNRMFMDEIAKIKLKLIK